MFDDLYFFMILNKILYSLFIGVCFAVLGNLLVKFEFPYNIFFSLPFFIIGIVLLKQLDNK